MKAPAPGKWQPKVAPKVGPRLVRDVAQRSETMTLAAALLRYGAPSLRDVLRGGMVEHAMVRVSGATAAGQLVPEGVIARASGRELWTVSSVTLMSVGSDFEHLQTVTSPSSKRLVVADADGVVVRQVDPYERTQVAISSTLGLRALADGVFLLDDRLAALRTLEAGIAMVGEFVSPAERGLVASDPLGLYSAGTAMRRSRDKAHLASWLTSAQRVLAALRADVVREMGL